MEDQPADPGDLTTGRRRWALFKRRTKTPEPEAVSSVDEVAQPEEPAPAPRTPVGKAGRTAKPVAEPESPAEETEPETPADSEETAEDVILVPHRPAGKRLTIAAAAAAALFVAAAAFAAATLQPYLANRAEVDVKVDVARTAANAITTL